jgi:uncharacterized membrane protein
VSQDSWARLPRRLIPRVGAPAERQAPSSTTRRLEAFSDGVISIAITLLVLEISIPEARPGKLFDALAKQWPSYAAFVLSFVVIGIMWVSHHSMFERIANVDRRLLFLNLLLLMGIAFLPFPTALLASYLRQGGSNSHLAAAVYSATMAVIGIFFLLMWHHLTRFPDLMIAGIGRDRAREAMRRSLVGPVVYGLTIPLAFISAWACFVVYALIALYFAAGPSSRVATPDDPSASGETSADDRTDEETPPPDESAPVAATPSPPPAASVAPTAPEADGADVRPEEK